MNKNFPRFLAILALLASGLWFSSAAQAQMDFSLDEGEEPVEDIGDAAGDAAGDMVDDMGDAAGDTVDEVVDDGGGMSFGTDEADAPVEEGDGSDAADFGAGEGDVIGDLVGEQTADTGPRDDAPRGTETVEEIYAVQQVYALRLNRVELAPSAAFTVNDPFVSHPAIGVALNYWWTNVLALGVNFLWYQFQDDLTGTDLNFFVRRSTRLAIPITQWQLGAYLNFTYVPFYGKFAGFNKFIFQWDAYIVGGIGIMRTRPVPIIDPEIRQFDFGTRVAFNVGVGIRIFVSRFLSIFTEFRNYMYLERFENTEVGLDTIDSDGDGTSDRLDQDTWLSGSNTFTNNTSVHVGFTIFFPFSFEYKLPK